MASCTIYFSLTHFLLYSNIEIEDLDDDGEYSEEKEEYIDQLEDIKGKGKLLLM